jgi:hypothetical protein
MTRVRFEYTIAENEREKTFRGLGNAATVLGKFLFHMNQFKEMTFALSN